MIQRINQEEDELKMDNVPTIITTIVSIGKLKDRDLLFSEKLLKTSNLDGNQKTSKMDKMRSNFSSQRDLISIGKLVPNPIRE